MANSEPTNGEIMEFLQEHVATKEDVAGIRSELRSEIRASELRMMDAVDEKLATLKGDLTVMMRGEDRKLIALIRALNEEKSLSDEKAGMLLGMQPFPQA